MFSHVRIVDFTIIQLSPCHKIPIYKNNCRHVRIFSFPVTITIVVISECLFSLLAITSVVISESLTSPINNCHVIVCAISKSLFSVLEIATVVMSEYLISPTYNCDV